MKDTRKSKGRRISPEISSNFYFFYTLRGKKKGKPNYLKNYQERERKTEVVRRKINSKKPPKSEGKPTVRFSAVVKAS